MTDSGESARTPASRPSESGKQSDMIGREIGNYVIETLLGVGGMGQVFRARHKLLDRLVALKVMHGNLAQDPTFQARFRQEARSAAALRHPHIVEVFDFDEHGGFAYLVMELITGGSLRTPLREGTAADPDWSLGRGLDLIRQAADALAYAHALGMVHRDIKPDNLLLQPGPNNVPILKVGDFGLARISEGSGLTAAGTAMGTPAYMSPEQCQGRDLDGRSDIYALGVVLYELATGTLPFTVKTVSEAVFKHVYVAPTSPQQVRPDVPDALNAVILRCLAKTPDERFASSADLAAALREVLGGVAPGDGASMLMSIPALGNQAGTGTVMHQPPALGNTPQVHTLMGGTSLPRVQVLDAEGTLLQVVAVRTSGLSIGRMDTNELALNDPSVSRNHLRLDWDGNQVVVTDLGSRSGTILGDARLSPQTPQPWPWRTLLQIGPYWLRLDPPTTAGQPSEPGSGGRGASTPAGGSATPMSGMSMAFSQSFVSTGQIGVVLEPETLALTPGKPAIVDVTLANMSSAPDQLSLSVSGVPSEWVTTPPAVQLGPNGSTTVRLTITVPEAVDSTAGDYPVEVKARSRTNPGEGGTVLARWTVLPFARLGMSIAPGRVQGALRGKYRVVLRNEGNSSARYRLSGSDTDEALRFSFTPDQLALEAGANETSIMTVEHGARITGGSQNHSIEVKAQNVDGGQVQTSAAQFVHQPVLPVWGMGLLLMLILGAAGWFSTFFLNSGSRQATPTPFVTQPVAVVNTPVAGETQTAVTTADDPAQQQAQTATAQQAVVLAAETATAAQATIAAVDQSNAAEVAAAQTAQAVQTAQADTQAQETSEAQNQAQAAETAQAEAQSQQQQQQQQTQTAQVAAQQPVTQTAQAQQAGRQTQTALAQANATQVAVTLTAAAQLQNAEATGIAQTQIAQDQALQSTSTARAALTSVVVQTAAAAQTAQANQTNVVLQTAQAAQTVEAQTALALAQTQTAGPIIQTQTALAQNQTATAAVQQTSVAATATAVALNQVFNATFNPGSPASMTANSRVNITFQYSTSDPGGVRIWFQPYTGSAYATNGFYGPSDVYPAAINGNGVTYIGISSGAVTVDRLKVIMRSEAQGITLYETYIPVNYQYSP